MWAGEYNSYGGGGVAVRYESRPTGFVKFYPIADHLGSTRVVLSDAGIESTANYDPFGNLLTSTGTDERLSWIGKENDTESNFGNFGVRNYDSELGRFVSVDPIWESFRRHTPYHYSKNNPLTLKDPSGFGPRPIQDQLWSPEGDGTLSDDEMNKQAEAYKKKKAAEEAKKRAADNPSEKTNFTLQGNVKINTGAVVAADINSVGVSASVNAIEAVSVNIGLEDNSICYVGNNGTVTTTSGLKSTIPGSPLGAGLTETTQHNNGLQKKELNSQTFSIVIPLGPFLSFEHERTVNTSTPNTQTMFNGFVIGYNVGVGVSVDATLKIGGTTTITR